MEEFHFVDPYSQVSNTNVSPDQSKQFIIEIPNLYCKWSEYQFLMLFSRGNCNIRQNPKLRSKVLRQ